MAKRDLISEILEKNNRAAGKYLRGSSELSDLEREFSKIEGDTGPIFSMYLMSVAACLEVCVRESIRILIDFGSPYFDRVENFKEHLRFDFALTKSLSVGEITFGDLVAHLLPVSSVEHIVSHLDSLLGSESRKKGLRWHLSEIREFVEPDEDVIFGNRPHEVADPDTRPRLVSNPDHLLTEIAGLFEARHVAAHEADFKSVDRERMAGFMRAAREFVDAIYEIIEQNLHPGSSRNGMGMSIQFSMEAGRVVENCREAEARIREALKNADFKKDECDAEFEKTVESFDEYALRESEFKFSLYNPFSGNAMRNIEAGVRKTLYEKRLEYLGDLEKEIVNLAR